MKNEQTRLNMAGFSMLEVIIGLSLLIGGMLVLVQAIVSNNEKTTLDKKMSDIHKAIITEALGLRLHRFEELKTAATEAITKSYKCENSVRPSSPNSTEKLLFTWKRLNALIEYCVDFDSFELKANGSILDVKLRVLNRKAGTVAINKGEKFFVMRKGK